MLPSSWYVGSEATSSVDLAKKLSYENHRYLYSLLPVLKTEDRKKSIDVYISMVISSIKSKFKNASHIENPNILMICPGDNPEDSASYLKVKQLKKIETGKSSDRRSRKNNSRVSYSSFIASLTNPNKAIRRQSKISIDTVPMLQDDSQCVHVLNTAFFDLHLASKLFAIKNDMYQNVLLQIRDHILPAIQKDSSLPKSVHAAAQMLQRELMDLNDDVLQQIRDKSSVDVLSIPDLKTFMLNIFYMTFMMIDQIRIEEMYKHYMGVCNSESLRLVHEFARLCIKSNSRPSNKEDLESYVVIIQEILYMVYRMYHFLPVQQIFDPAVYKYFETHIFKMRHAIQQFLQSHNSAFDKLKKKRKKKIEVHSEKVTYDILMSEEYLYPTTCMALALSKLIYSVLNQVSENFVNDYELAEKQMFRVDPRIGAVLKKNPDVLQKIMKEHYDPNIEKKILEEFEKSPDKEEILKSVSDIPNNDSVSLEDLINAAGVNDIKTYHALNEFKLNNSNTYCFSSAVAEVLRLKNQYNVDNKNVSRLVASPLYSVPLSHTPRPFKDLLNEPSAEFNPYTESASSPKDSDGKFHQKFLDYARRAVFSRVTTYIPSYGKTQIQNSSTVLASYYDFVNKSQLEKISLETEDPYFRPEVGQTQMHSVHTAFMNHFMNSVACTHEADFCEYFDDFKHQTNIELSKNKSQYFHSFAMRFAIASIFNENAATKLDNILDTFKEQVNSYSAGTGIGADCQIESILHMNEMKNENEYFKSSFPKTILTEYQKFVKVDPDTTGIFGISSMSLKDSPELIYAVRSLDEYLNSSKRNFDKFSIKSSDELLQMYREFMQSLAKEYMDGKIAKIFTTIYGVNNCNWGRKNGYYVGKNGRIDCRRLARFSAEIDMYPFKNLNMRQYPNIDTTILLDNSSSMSGNFKNHLAIAMAIVEVLRRIPGFRARICTFKHIVLDYKEPIHRVRFVEAGGDTPLHIPTSILMNETMQNLIQKRSRKQVLIYITDGEVDERIKEFVIKVMKYLKNHYFVFGLFHISTGYSRKESQEFERGFERGMKKAIKYLLDNDYFTNYENCIPKKIQNSFSNEDVVSYIDNVKKSILKKRQALFERDRDEHAKRISVLLDKSPACVFSSQNELITKLHDIFKIVVS